MQYVASTLRAAVQHLQLVLGVAGKASHQAKEIFRKFVLLYQSQA